MSDVGLGVGTIFGMMTLWRNRHRGARETPGEKNSMTLLYEAQEAMAADRDTRDLAMELIEERGRDESLG